MTTGRRQTDLRIQKVVQLLTANPSHPLPELANGCQISVSRLTHLFKGELGITLKNYRLEHRLQASAVMLALTDVPIKAIAYNAGYHHTSSFMRAFKTRFGVSPACYRRASGIAASANQ